MFVQQVDQMSTQGNLQVEKHAAVVIQASWRGYSTRKKMKRVHNGIRNFQLFYRRWKAIRANGNARSHYRCSPAVCKLPPRL